eukprot:Colp12_sorted_trinity150504_noHs@20350
MASRSVLVYGGKGALGSALVSHFKEHSWKVLSVDLFANENADVNIVLSPSDDLDTQSTKVNAEVGVALADTKLDAVLCVAGGWAGGNASNKDFVKNTDLMVKQSINSSVVAAHIAAVHLKEGGLALFTGALAATGPTPFMLGYGLAKAAVHHLVTGLASPTGGLPKDSTALAILPVTLDTPMNRKFMADADFTTWTPLSAVAEKSFEWATNPASRPATGSLVKVTTAGGVTTFA